MVVPSPIPIRSKKTKAIGIPVIDLSADRSELAETILRACEEYGIFKVINHGVPQDTISRLEDEGFDFFAKPMMEKQRAGPANPFGYGCKNIGPNGDMGELEYLLLHSDPLSISEGSKNASADSAKFRNINRARVVEAWIVIVGLKGGIFSLWRMVEDFSEMKSMALSQKGTSSF